jgi:hypothetical protein
MKYAHVSFLALLLTSAIPAQADTIYLADSLGNLYEGNPTTLAFNLVGTTSAVSAEGGFSDISFTSDGNLYGIDSSGLLYAIDPTNASATPIGTGTGVGGGELAGLAGDSSGNLYAGGYGEIFAINPATGLAGMSLGGGNQGYNVSGDLDFIGNTLYLSSANPTSNPATSNNGGELWTVNPATGVGVDIGNTGFADLWGLAYDTDNGIFYGYTSNGNEIEINPATGTGVSVGTITGTDIPDGEALLLGATFEPPAPAPEPSTLSCLGAGLAVILLLSIRRRNRRATL